MKVKALRNEVLIRRIIKEKTQSGIIIPEEANSCMKGEVLSVGKKLDSNGNETDLEVSEGDIVIFPKGTGQELNTGDEKLLMVKSEDILGILLEE